MSCTNKRQKEKLNYMCMYANAVLNCKYGYKTIKNCICWTSEQKKRRKKNDATSSKQKKLLRLLNACNTNAQPSIKPLHAVISWVQYHFIHSNDKTFIFSISCACHFPQNHALILFPFDIVHLVYVETPRFTSFYSRFVQ